MSSIDLSIIQRGVQGNDWNNEKGKLDAATLSAVTEQRTDNGSALNALPTPYARFFVVKEAYRRLREQRQNPSLAAGIAYERLVSDSLDIFEMLFNKAYHEAKGERIRVIEWHREEDLERLKKDVPKLGNALESYIQDVQGVSFDTLYFVVMEIQKKDYLLGTSSPLTGFITPPDLDRQGLDGNTYVGERYKAFPDLQRKGERKSYFKQVCLFEDRSPEFKNYMYDQLCRQKVDDSLSCLRSYIGSFENDPDIQKEFQERLQPILTEENDHLVVGGMPISASNEVADYFTNILIRLPYGIANENFILPNYKGKKITKGDYLLPLSEEALATLDLEKLVLEVNERQSFVEVTLDTKGKKFSKKYTIGGSGNDRLVDLSVYQLDIDLALFPNLKSESHAENNRYYKLMLAAHQSDLDISRFTIDDITCDFFVKDTEGTFSHIQEAQDVNYQSGVRLPIVRSRQKRESEKSVSTKYYELFNTGFTAIRLNFRLEDEYFSGVLVPKWRTVKESERSYIYAIDLGTTNTFVSRRENKKDKDEPQQLCMVEPFVSYLHAKESNKQKALIDCWEDSLPDNVEAAFRSEFLPSFIDGRRYRFPIRTVICESGQSQQGPSDLFGEKNIAFSYGRKKESEGNTINTRIKWETDESEQELRIFIRELLLMVKCDVLQQKGKVSATQLVWFRPLSFMHDAREMFERLWKEEAKQVLNIPEQQIVCYTESEAPYYYFSEKNVFRSEKSVAVVDIGGGSTDIVLFEQRTPKLANSVHFGCDVLWSNGFNNMQNAKSNGVFLFYKDRVKFNDEELNAIYGEMTKTDSRASSCDIINFWLTNRDKVEVERWLRKDFQPLFLYHFVAVMFYLAIMFRSKELDAPRSIVLSGNGSRYIDSCITNDTAILEKLICHVFNAVYEDGLKEELQVVLPSVRKESTCYGGLFRDSTLHAPATYLFMGVDSRQYDDIAQLETAFHEELCSKLVQQIGRLNKVYLEVLQLLTKELDIEAIYMEKVQELISGNVQDMLDKYFCSQVTDKYKANQVYRDSLFFLPVVDIVFQLTHLKSEKKK